MLRWSGAVAASGYDRRSLGLRAWAPRPHRRGPGHFTDLRNLLKSGRRIASWRVGIDPVEEPAMRRIFAIDDEKEWLELYVEILADEGYEVTPFTDGRMAIEAMKKGAPDAVILDLRMAPSGRDVLKSIRRTWPTMPVVISSAYGGYHNDPDFDSVESFVEKSTDLLSLRLALESAISKTAGALQPGRSQPPCV